MYIMYKGKKYSSNNANNISFDNSNTDLSSTNVQDTICELNKNLESLSYYELLATSNETVWKNFSVKNLSQYREIMIKIRNTSGRTYNVARIPINMFINDHNTVTSAFCLEAYTSIRSYSGIYYIDDTTIAMQGTNANNTGMFSEIYGIF